MNHGHGHGHGPDTLTDIDWAAMVDAMELEAETHAPYVAQAFDHLVGLRPRRILDVGSGPGVAACRLAATFGQAEVTAVDGSPELLVRAEQRAARFGLTLRTHRADFPDGLADLEPADLIWSAQAVHHVGDQQRMVHALAGRLTPGGTLALVEGGLGERWLPHEIGLGRPGLQARLEALLSEAYTRMRAELPDAAPAPAGWPTMLRNAGLTDVRSRSFLVDHPAPLAAGPRQAVRNTLVRYRDGFAEHLDPDDRATLDRLLDPADPLGLDRRDDVFLLVVKTVHFGRLPD